MSYANASEVSNILEEIYYTLYYGMGIAELGIAGVLLMVAIISAIVSGVITILIWLLESIPVYKLAKNAGRKSAWIAWVPFFGNYFRMYVLADIPGDEPFVVSGKHSIKSRSMAFWTYLGVGLFGGTIINVIVFVVNIFIPVVGMLSLVLSLLPWIITCVMEYIFLKDVLNVFKPDRKANKTAAVIITVLDNIATLGFARLVYLYTLLKYKPISKDNAPCNECAATVQAIDAPQN